MDIVIWTYIFGGATIFALIVGVFSVWNGRMTRKELAGVIERTSRYTQDIIKDTAERTDKILERQEQMLERQRQMLERQGQMLERQGQMLERLEQTQKYIADIVRIEGEKTRSLITH